MDQIEIKPEKHCQVTLIKAMLGAPNDKIELHTEIGEKQERR